MADKMIAVPESLLDAIGMAIGDKRDITTPIPVPDMPMQIGLIDGGGLPQTIEKIASGYVDSDNTDGLYVYIPHNFNDFPDIIFVKQNVSIVDSKSGSCYMCVYTRIPDNGITGNVKKNSYEFLYLYKHITSNNLLGGRYNSGVPSTDVNTYSANRGGENWTKIDNNGNPIDYQWVAVKFKEYKGEINNA